MLLRLASIRFAFQRARAFLRFMLWFGASSRRTRIHIINGCRRSATVIWAQIQTANQGVIDAIRPANADYDECGPHMRVD